MFNPLALINHWMTLNKEIPPVHLSYIAPMAHNLPKEIAVENFNDEEHQLVSAYVGLENFSTTVLENVRLKLRSPLQYAPRFWTDDSRGYVDYEFNETDNEIFIKKIDPHESVYIDLYPDVDKLVRDFKPQVIINGKMLTKAMMKHGAARKYPIPIWFYMFILFALGVLAWSMYITWTQVQLSGVLSGDRELLQSATSALQGGCYLKVVEVTDDTKMQVLRSYMNKNFILEINKSSSLDELLSREKIVLCIAHGIE